MEALGLGKNDIFRQGLVWTNIEGKRYFEVLPSVLGMDGKWRFIPRELLACPGPAQYPPEQQPIIISGDDPNPPDKGSPARPRRAHRVACCTMVVTPSKWIRKTSI